MSKGYLEKSMKTFIKAKSNQADIRTLTNKELLHFLVINIEFPFQEVPNCLRNNLAKFEIDNKILTYIIVPDRWMDEGSDQLTDPDYGKDTIKRLIKV